MKIEKLSKGNGNKKFVYGLILGISLIVIINILFSYSKYKAEDNVDLAEGTINYVIPDLKLMAVYVKEGNEFEKKDTVPSDAIYQVVKGVGENTSYCVDLDGNKIDNVYMKYENGALDIKVTKKGTKCWIYLEKATLLNKDILAKNPPKESTYNETYPYIAEFTGISTTDEGVYSMVDYDGEETYYFRGAVEDNYVHFANFYWRIIRINSDGSIRMIYDGTSAHSNGESNEDRVLERIAYNSSKDDAKYVGFMYGKASTSTQSYDAANKNEVPSTILANLNAWYEKNLQNFENYLEKNAIFCNDRRSYDDLSMFWINWLNSGGKNVTAQNEIIYGPLMRTYSNTTGWYRPQLADLSCQPNDRFTPNNATRGNKSMKYPIGLISIDEALMGGAYVSLSNHEFYLFTGSSFWTISPTDTYLSANSYFMLPGGGYGAGSVDTESTVRPVINLKANTTFSKGNGSINAPYEII